MEVWISPRPRGYSTHKIYESVDFLVHSGSSNTPDEDRVVFSVELKKAYFTLYGGGEELEAFQEARQAMAQDSYCFKLFLKHLTSEQFEGILHAQYCNGQTAGRRALQKELRDLLDRNV